MRKKPIKGLLAIIYYSTIGKLMLTLIACLVFAGIALITGWYMAFSVFRILALTIPPVIVIMHLLHKSAEKWERLQVTMPVKRNGMLAAQFIYVFITAVVGIPIALAVAGLGVHLHENMFYHGFLIEMIQFAMAFGVPLVTAGIMYPLARTTIGMKWGEVVFVATAFAAVGLFQLIGMAAYRLGAADGVKLAVFLGVSLVVFVCSYFITARVYAGVDF